MHNWGKHSIKQFTKSLLVCNSQCGHPLSGYPNLSSKRFKECIKEIHREESHCQQITKNDERYEYAYFEYRNDKTGLRMTHWINLLSSIENQDIINWGISFNELS
ncbi:hypothetical protein EQH57_0472 [Dictyocoela roeselum]|nr:hypothetical protein EQH57_0472 [Dictyocoela roeselum]